MKLAQLFQSLEIKLNKKLAIALFTVAVLLVNVHHGAKAVINGNTVTAQELLVDTESYVKNR